MRTRTIARSLWAVLASMGAGFVLSACHAAIVFTVDTTLDEADASPGDGQCSTPGGTCSLRAAVQEANVAGKSVEISLAPGATYELSIGGTDEDAAATGDLDVTGNIVITGNGARIDGNDVDRVLDVRSGRLALHDLTLRNGRSTDGAGIRSVANLNLGDVTMTGFTAPPGGEVGGAIVHYGGALNVTRSVVGGYTGFDARAGGIVQLAGTVSIVDSLVSGNVSQAGAYEFRQLGGTATILNSSIRSDDRLVTVPFCGEFGCVDVEISVYSWAASIDGHADVIRSTIGHRVIQGTQFMWGTGTVDARGSLLYGLCTSPTVVSSGYNAFRSDAPCAADPVATDLLLAAAPQETLFVPNAGESVIDAIPPDTPGLCYSVDDHDRRLLPRPVGIGCDIGSVERQPGDP